MKPVNGKISLLKYFNSLQYSFPQRFEIEQFLNFFLITKDYFDLIFFFVVNGFN